MNTEFIMELTTNPIKLVMSVGADTVELEVHSATGMFTLTCGDDLLASDETSYFNLDREEYTLDGCRLTVGEKITVMYTLFMEKFMKLLSESSTTCKFMAMKEIVVGGKLLDTELIKFYCALTGNNSAQVSEALRMCFDDAKNFKVTPTVGGLLADIDEVYLSTGHKLAISTHGTGLVGDTEFIDLRILDTGDTRWAPINFYSKVCKVGVRSSSVNSVRGKIQKFLNLYVLGEIIHDIPEIDSLDTECYDTLVSQLVNIYWRHK